MERSKKIKVRRPIGVKLAAIFGFVVLISLGAVTFISSYLMGQDVQITAENNNLTINTRAATTINDKLTTVRSNVFQLLDLLGVVNSNRTQAIARQAESFFFERNPEIACIYVISGTEANTSDQTIVNNQFFISNEIDSSYITRFITSSEKEIGRSCNGETILLNTSPFFTIPTMALLFPWKENGRDQTCIIVFSIESVSDILGTGSENTTYIINDSDELLCHPDVERILAGESLRNYSLVQLMREHNQNNDDSRQIPFSTFDEDGKEHQFFAAYEKLNYGDAVIFTEVSKELVLEAVNNTFKNNLYIMGCVFFLTLIIALVYAKFGISNPIKKLTFAAREIQEGNFDTEIIDKLNRRRKDEIGVLNQSTKD